MNILLLNPPFKPEYGKFSREQRSPAVTKSGTFYYPMWLAYAAALLEEKGFDCRLIDAPAKQKSWKEISQDLVDYKPELIVVDTSTPSIENDVRIAADIKSMTGAYTLLVGPHVSALPEETLNLNDQIDGVARKEYEYTVLELARALQNGDALSSIKGLTYRENGEIIHNPERPLPDDLDNLPFVSMAYKKHLEYRDYFYAHSKHPIVTLITGRGCPHECVYCVYPQVFNSRRLRNRSVKNVIDEVEYVLNEFPDVQEIMFEDDTLTINKKRARAFANEIIERGLKFEWSANSRADVDLDTMKILRKAGARLFCVGVESGDQDVLDQMKKKLKVEQIRQFFSDAKKAGILIHGCFLVGNPGETKDTLEKTLCFAKELNPDTAQFFPIMVYPGTEAYRWSRQNNFLEVETFQDWLTEDGLHNCVVSRPGLTNLELVEFCDKARREYYTIPAYIYSKILQGLMNPSEFKRLLKGGKTLSKHLWRGTFGRSDSKS